jgi:predicted transposase/invertase (TIGR01784 family)
MKLSAAYLKRRQECLAEGRKQVRQEVAIASLREGLSPEVIAKITGLSLEEIEQLSRLTGLRN